MTAAAVTLAVCAVVLTGVSVRTAFFPPRWTLTVPEDTVREWRSYGSGGLEDTLSRSRASLVVFSDYQCDMCRGLFVQIAQLRARYPDALTVVWRHFPLPTHAFAAQAARAAVCAAAQDRFEPMHALLFLKADSLHALRWTSVAVAAGVRDTVVFASCLASQQATEAVGRDIAAGRVLGVPGTPTILLDSLLFVGAPRDLSRLVRRQVRG